MSENEKIEQAGQADAAKSAPAKADKKAKDEKKSKPGFFARVAKWFKEMKSELKKVIWPTGKQLTNNTLVSVVMMVASAIVLWGFDWLANALVKALLTLAG